MPTERSRVRSALPEMLLISFCRNELRASFMENEERLLSERYMPVVSIVTATLPRSSVDMACSSLSMVMFSGASMMNSSPMLLSVWLIATPQLKVTDCVVPSTVALALVSSVAVMLSFGFMSSPVNSTYEPSAILNVFSGITGREYFISPSLTV